MTDMVVLIYYFVTIAEGGMDIFNEKVDYENPFLSLKVFQSERTSDIVGQWHFHSELEILVILEGRLDVYVEEEFYPLREGDVIVIGSSQLHRDRSYSASRLQYIVLQFDIRHFFDQSTMPYIRCFFETKSPLSRINYIFQEHPDAKRIVYDCVIEILRETQQKQVGYEIAVNLLVKKIILTLLRSDSRKQLNLRSNPDLNRLKPVLDYVEQNIEGKINVVQACKVANVSYYYFVKYFKKVIGMSFTEYVNYQKIKRAERILLTKDMSIAQVGEAIGMPNMAHFYKVFRKYNECSPNEYRKKMLSWRNQ
jgi:AraC-like DNA-binding protein/mannose-6-phosphate isomerase-like protein (cupin superfamily)